MMASDWNYTVFEHDPGKGMGLGNETTYRVSDLVPGFINGSNMQWNSSDYLETSTVGGCFSGEDGNTTSGCVTVDTNATDAPAFSCVPNYELWQVVVLGILGGSTSIITVLGNLVVILSFILERTIRQPTNYFIASLACSDLLIGSLSMPFYTVYLLTGQKWMLGEVMCDLWLSIDYTVCLTSIYTVFCITIDRFCMVKLPAKYRTWRTERKVLSMVAFTWVVPAVVFFTSIFGWQYFVGRRSVPPDACFVQYMDDAVFNCVLQLGYFWVTLTVMIVLYTGIYKVALDLHKKSAAKQKKMTSLVSMAGQTMTKIGIGMSQQHQAMDLTKKMFQNQDTLKPSAKGSAANGRSANTNNNQHAKRISNTTSFSSQGGKEDERSSSPIYPSDTDLSSQSPNRQHSPKPRRSQKAKNRTSHNGKLRKGKDKQKAIAKAVPTPIIPQQVQEVTSKPSPPTQIPLSQQQSNDTRVCSPVSSLAEDNKTPVYENSALAVEDNCINDDSESELAPLQGYKQKRVFPHNTTAAAVATPELLTGLRFIDQESLKSLESTDTIRLLVEPKLNNPDTHIVEEPESPIWKPRDALLSDPDAVEGPKSPIKLSPPPIRSTKSTGKQVGSSDVGRKLATVPDYGGVYIAAGPEPATFPPRSSQPQTVTETMPSSSNVDSALIQVDTNADNTTVTRIADKSSTNNSTRSGKGLKRDRDSKYKHISSPLRSLLKSSSSRKRRSQQKKEKKNSGKVQKSKTENRARKALRTITIILGAFVLCWTPWHILSMTLGFSKNISCGVYMLYDISYWLCYLNSPINPFCYAMANQQFKKAFIRIIKLDWHRT